MTTIIGIQGDSYAVICADSRVTEVDYDGTATQSISLKEIGFKIAQNGRYLMGVAGDVRAINILTHAFNPPTPPTILRGRKLDHFITTKFIPSLRQCFDIEGYSNPHTESSVHQAEQSSIIMVAINGTMRSLAVDTSKLSIISSFFIISIHTTGKINVSAKTMINQTICKRSPKRPNILGLVATMSIAP